MQKKKNQRVFPCAIGFGGEGGSSGSLGFGERSAKRKPRPNGLGGFAEPSGWPSGCSGLRRVLPSFTEFSEASAFPERKSISLDELSIIVKDLLGFYWVVLGFTGFYWVLLGFTGFYWVLLWSVVFDWVLPWVRWRRRRAASRSVRWPG